MDKEFQGRVAVVAGAAKRAGTLDLDTSGRAWRQGLHGGSGCEAAGDGRAAFELAPSQVLVNGVSPGPIATETAKGQGWLEERIKTIPLGRAAEPDDMAEVVLYLASERNRILVGETVLANGGSLMA